MIGRSLCSATHYSAEIISNLLHYFQVSSSIRLSSNLVQLRRRVLDEPAAGARGQQPRPLRGSHGCGPAHPAAQCARQGVPRRETDLPCALDIVGIYFTCD